MAQLNEQIIAEALDALEQGVPTEKILRQYPLHRAKLAPILQMAQQLDERPLEPTTWTQRKARQAFLQTAASLPQPEVPWWKSIFSASSLPRLATNLALIALFIFSGWWANTAVQQAEPGSFLYPLKSLIMREENEVPDPTLEPTPVIIHTATPTDSPTSTPETIQTSESEATEIPPSTSTATPSPEATATETVTATAGTAVPNTTPELILTATSTPVPPEAQPTSTSEPILPTATPANDSSGNDDNDDSDDSVTNDSDDSDDTGDNDSSDDNDSSNDNDDSNDSENSEGSNDNDGDSDDNDGSDSSNQEESGDGDEDEEED